MRRAIVDGILPRMRYIQFAGLEPASILQMQWMEPDDDFAGFSPRVLQVTLNQPCILPRVSVPCSMSLVVIEEQEPVGSDCIELGSLTQRRRTFAVRLLRIEHGCQLFFDGIAIV